MDKGYPNAKETPIFMLINHFRVFPPFPYQKTPHKEPMPLRKATQARQQKSTELYLVS